jgi:thioredoxin-related protein
MKKLYLIFSFVPLVGMAQSIGVLFEHGLNWQQVQAKARAENKYIFVDCYATWCGPCKQMDNRVYPLKDVGDYYNTHFISIRVQLDTSGNDSDAIKSWYSDASHLRAKYNVNVLPTFLFFAPDGSIVHQSNGFVDETDFIALGRDALDPDKQYYTLLDEYERGKKIYSGMAHLAIIANKLDNKLAQTIANDYIDNYLSRLNDSELYTKQNIQFIREFTTKSNGRGFRLFYNNSGRINQTMGQSEYAEGLIEYVISKEEIDPNLVPLIKISRATPDWSGLYTRIAYKYNSAYASKIVITSKVRWYGVRKEWINYTKYVALTTEKYGANYSNYDLNSVAWEIFLHSSKNGELNKALSWSKRAISKDPQYPNSMDTYANLLYKLGRKNEAILFEQKAAALDSTNREIQDNFIKMKSGKPTWSE